MAPRLARLVVAHTPHHIVQRGHSRQAIFAEPEDYQSYLSDLREKTMELGVQVHAYCLMTNHVHLMLTPSEETKAIGRVMQETGRRATRRWNQRCRRSGTLWESRYKSSVVQTETYLLACCRYIELNPVRARMVARAEDYPWSSYRSRMGISDMGVLALHPVYQAMGRRIRIGALPTEAMWSPRSPLKSWSVSGTRRSLAIRSPRRSIAAIWRPHCRGRFRPEGGGAPQKCSLTLASPAGKPP